MNLSNIRLSGIPEAFCGLLDLKHLSLSADKIIDYYYEGDSNLNSIPTLPNSFCQLIGLVKLLIVGVGISDLPESIYQLRNLEILDVSKNCISWLPASFTCLLKLRVLNISNNCLYILPLDFNKLKSLQHLLISHNKISQLPENIEVAGNLVTLDIYDNEVDFVDHSLIVNSSLIRFDVAMNYLEVGCMPTSEVILYNEMQYKLRTCKEDVGEQFIVLVENAESRSCDSKIKPSVEEDVFTKSCIDENRYCGCIGSCMCLDFDPSNANISGPSLNDSSLDIEGKLDPEDWSEEVNDYGLIANCSFQYNLQRMDLENYWGDNQFCPADHHATPRSESLVKKWENLIRNHRLGSRVSNSEMEALCYFTKPNEFQFEDAEVVS